MPTARLLETKALSQQERVLYLRRVLTADTMPAVDPRPRPAGAAVRPASAPHHATDLDDLIHDDSEALLRLGELPISISAPFAEILTTNLGTRLITAVNPNSRFPSPEDMPDSPCTPPRCGCGCVCATPACPTKPHESPRCELMLQAPPSVVATMLGYHPNTAELIAAEAGMTWQS
ncbi:hypothetical protein [Lentzea sp. NPDC060358]|uniref:hypothetical protein n=1 Tax=Lentzea sp. NPDC060358 TaxID=3347103 RepID=UPI00365D99CC